MRLLPTILGATVAAAAVLSCGTIATAATPPATIARAESPTALAAETGTWGTAPWSLEDGILTVEPGTLGSRGWEPLKNEVTRIVFTDPANTKLPAHAAEMFAKVPNLVAIEGIEQLDTSAATTFSSMFWESPKLTSLDLSAWKTGSVNNLYAMFWKASGLTSLNLAGWDTSNVETTAFMFQGDSSLTDLDISGWDLGNVTDMQAMFQDVSSLTTLDVSDWDTSSVVNMEALFHNAHSLKELDVTGWNTSKVEIFKTTFYGTTALTKLDPSGFDTSSATTMHGTFAYASALTELDLSGWNTGKVTNMEQLFSDTTSLNLLKTAGWDTSQVTTMEYLFTRSGASSVQVAGWNVEKVQTLFGAFGEMANLTAIDLSGWNTESVTDMDYFFSETPLRAITISDETTIPDGVDLWIPSALIEPLANGKWVEIGSGSIALPIRTKWDGTNEDFYNFTASRLDAGTYVWQETIIVNYEGNNPQVSGNTERLIGGTGRPVTIAENGFTVDKATFTGWNTEANGSGTAFTAGQVENLAAGEYTLYAQWDSATKPVDPTKPTPKPGTLTNTGAESAWGVGVAGAALLAIGALLALRRKSSK